MAFKQVAVAIMLSTLWLPSSALALTQSKTGAVKSTNLPKRELVLTTGDRFQVSSKIRLSKLKVGDRIRVRYSVKGDRLIASKVVPVR